MRATLRFPRSQGLASCSSQVRPKSETSSCEFVRSKSLPVQQIRVRAELWICCGQHMQDAAESPANAGGLARNSLVRLLSEEARRRLREFEIALRLMPSCRDRSRQAARRHHTASPSAILRSAPAIASAASSAFAMGPLKRGADFGDGLIEIFVQPRDPLLLFAEFFSARCRFCPSGGG
jgi:hypothetical protein